jgi:predicted dehydrogenase
MIRLGLIGCGEHSEIGHAIPLARYMAANPAEVELSAVCDLRLDRAKLFCEKYGFQQAFSDAEAMLRSVKLDGCIAVVPVEKISSVGTALLERGIPCSIEKPLGADLKQVQALVDAAKRSGTPNMVSVNRRFMPFLNRAIAWAQSIGSLQYVRATMTRHQRTESDFLPTTAVHAVDALRHIAGEIRETRIQRVGDSVVSGAWYTIDLRFDDGFAGRVDVLPTSGMLEETYELFGEGFRAIVTAPFGPRRGLRCYRANQLVLEETDAGVPEDVIFGFYEEAGNFIRAVAHGGEVRPSIADVSPSVELCLRLSQSA